MVEPIWDLLGLGSVTVDEFLCVPRFPRPDGKLQVSEVYRQGGGLAGTALVTVARLQGRAAYCGVLGTDEQSGYVLDGLEQEGVDCRYVRRRAEARPFYAVVIIVEGTGQRSILFSDAGIREPEPDQITAELVESCRVLFVDHTVPVSGLKAARLAHARGIPVVGDFETAASAEQKALLDEVDHLIVGAELAQELTGESQPAAIVAALSVRGALNERAALGGRAASERSVGTRTATVVTMGAQGGWYMLRGETPRPYPAFPVQAVDTTGCGDVFHGTYALCLGRGFSLERAIVYASAAAALKATRPGGRTGIPDWESVEGLAIRVL